MLMHLYHLMYENDYADVFYNVRCPFNNIIPWDKMTMPYETLTGSKFRSKFV